MSTEPPPLPLSCTRIFSSTEFAEESFDRPRWMTSSSLYTTLTARKGGDGETTGHEIWLHDASNLQESRVLVSINDLIPSQSSSPLRIDDYSISQDMSKVLIFTDAQKVWRLKTRGTYWILHLGSGRTIRPLGQPEQAREMMFCTFSPSLDRVAYVYRHNIFVEDLESKLIHMITDDGSFNIINGTFDWYVGI